VAAQHYYRTAFATQIDNDVSITAQDKVGLDLWFTPFWENSRNRRILPELFR